MAAKSVTWWQGGVVEVVGWVVGHAELFHHAAGAQVAGNGESDEAVELELVEGVIDDGASAFGGKAAAPKISSETPADFYSGHEGRVVTGDVEADESDEGFGFNVFGGAEAEAVMVEVQLDAGDEVVGLLWKKRAGHELHDARVGVDGLEWDAVGVTPMAEDQARGGEDLVHTEKASTSRTDLNSKAREESGSR